MPILKEFSTGKARLIFLGCAYGLILLLLLLHVLVALVPWLHDSRAPLVSIEGIGRHQSFKDMINITVRAEDDTTAVRGMALRVDGELIEEDSTPGREANRVFKLNTAMWEQGKHLVEIDVSDYSFFAHRAVKQYEIFVDRTPPLLRLVPVAAEAWQGDTLPFFIRASEELKKLQAVFFGHTTLFYKSGHDDLFYRSLVGVPPLQPSKSFLITLTATDLAGNETTVSYAVLIKAKKFPQEKITLSPQKAGLLTDYEGIRLDYERITAAFKIISAVQLWQGRFIMPTLGRVTSPFGEQRVFNTTVYSIHRGIDLANKSGTPIAAANSGIVVLAEKLPLHGNAVIIDHGQGVLTLYAHMRKLTVTVNTRVQKGQIIGFMGDTGLTTGPHLHWEMRVNNVAINAGQWIDTAFNFP